MKLKITRDPIPRDNGPLLCDWLDNGIVRITEHATLLGVSVIDRTKFIEWCTMAKDACLGLSNVTTSAEAWRDYRQTLLYGSTNNNTPLARPVDNPTAAPVLVEPLLPGAMTRIRDFLQTLKPKQAWSAAIEADFRITPIVSEVDVDTAKPDGKAKSLAGAEVQLLWTRGPFDGVHLEWQIAGAPTWQNLGNITGSRYTHSAPLAQAGQPEERRYRMRFVVDNNAVGEWSNIIPVTVRP